MRTWRLWFMLKTKSVHLTWEIWDLWANSRTFMETKSMSWYFFSTMTESMAALDETVSFYWLFEIVMGSWWWRGSIWDPLTAGNPSQPAWGTSQQPSGTNSVPDTPEEVSLQPGQTTGRCRSSDSGSWWSCDHLWQTFTTEERRQKRQKCPLSCLTSKRLQFKPPRMRSCNFPVWQ